MSVISSLISSTTVLVSTVPLPVPFAGMKRPRRTERGYLLRSQVPAVDERYLPGSMVTSLSATAIYTMRIRIEVCVVVDLPMNHIILVATHYQGQPVKSVQKMQQISLWVGRVAWFRRYAHFGQLIARMYRAEVTVS